MILNGKVDHYAINHFEFGKKKFCAITYLISAKHLLIAYLYHFYDIEINLIITLSIFNVPNFFCQRRSSCSIQNMKTQWGNTFIAVSLIIPDNEILVDELMRICVQYWHNPGGLPQNRLSQVDIFNQ